MGVSVFVVGEAWVFVCLFRFNFDGFFYVYVVRLDVMFVCLLLFGIDFEAFYDMVICRRLVEDGMYIFGVMRVFREVVSFFNVLLVSVFVYSV